MYRPCSYSRSHQGSRRGTAMAIVTEYAWADSFETIPFIKVFEGCEEAQEAIDGLPYKEIDERMRAIAPGMVFKTFFLLHSNIYSALSDGNRCRGALEMSVVDNGVNGCPSGRYALTRQPLLSV